MRLIDADALVEQMESDAEHMDNMTFKLATYAAINDINHQPTIDPQKWISCDGRLPEKKGEYLVTYHPCYWDNVQQDIKVGIDSFRGKTSWAKKKHQIVIAWMSLPEPWKGEEE